MPWDRSSIRPGRRLIISTNDQQEAFEHLPGSKLARVFDLVRFAETKKAALLTFASAWILAMLNPLSSDRTLPAGFTPALLAALPVFASATFVCALSFQDRYRPARAKWRRIPGSSRASSASSISAPVSCAIAILLAPAVWHIAERIAR